MSDNQELPELQYWGSFFGGRWALALTTGERVEIGEVSHEQAHSAARAELERRGLKPEFKRVTKSL